MGFKTPRSELSVVAANACGWPILTKLPTGELICIHFSAPSHGLTEGDLICSKSHGCGRSWRKVSVVSKGPPKGNRMHLAVGLARNGDLLCFSSGFMLKDGKIDEFGGLRLSRSSDGGDSWFEDFNPKVPAKLNPCIPYGRIIKAGDGALAFSCYRSQGRGKPSESWVCFSEDDGRAWKTFRKLGDNDSNEVSLCFTSKGNLVACARTHVDHHLKFLRFFPHSNRWRNLGDVSLPMQHPADLIEFNESFLLATYGIRNRGLMGLGARISNDQGRSWSPPSIIHQFGDEASDVGYPSTICLDDKGNLLTAFYTDHEPSFGKSASKYRVLVKRWNWLDRI